jgi:4-diphosphocytidyl-2-C-methyl-D-erythritol kinase
MSLSALYDVPAPAKLNLFLHVIGRRADGYHLLQSVFVLIDWCDRLHFELRGDGVLARHDLGAALPADDLCLRAARSLQRQRHCARRRHFAGQAAALGRGLGGGSSDAASTLLALNRLWRLNWPRARLSSLAASLGADVPFFVGGDNAFVEGIGDKLTPVALPRAVLRRGQTRRGDRHRRHLRQPRSGARHRRCYTSGLFCDARCWANGPMRASAATTCRRWPRRVAPKCARPPVAAQPVRQQPHDGSGSAVFARVGTHEPFGGVAGARFRRHLGRSDVPQSGPSPASGLGRLRRFFKGVAAKPRPV